MVDFEARPDLDVFKAWMVKGADFSSAHEFPVLDQACFVPERAVPFEKAMKSVRARDTQQWVHFYMHDKGFECVWRNPKKYLGVFQRFDGVITPDYSLYRDMPLAMQVWNMYRNRALGYWLQSQGVPIIPNVRWGDERTYDVAFEGLGQGGTVAVSTNGCIQDKLDRYDFKKGLEKMVEALQPDTIVNYSYTPDDIFGIHKEQGIKVVQIENYLRLKVMVLGTKKLRKTITEEENNVKI